jgi:hypothetical protein
MSRDQKNDGRNKMDEIPFPPWLERTGLEDPEESRPCQHAVDPDSWESELWTWLTLSPDDPTRNDLEDRILSCPYCLAGVLRLARSEASAGAKPGWSLYQINTRMAAIERVRAMEKNDWFWTVITIVRDGLLRLDPAWAGQSAATVRGRPKGIVDPEVTSERHEIGNLEVSMEVERTGSSKCRVAVWVKDRLSGHPGQGMAYLSDQDGTVYESFPFHGGEIVFSGVAPGTYYIGVDSEDAPGGRIRLEIRKGG